MAISPDIFSFLSQLAENNNKAWFEPRKPEYQALRLNVQTFLSEMAEALQTIEGLPPQNFKQQVFRIYKDVRFAKDKTPYKTYTGAYLNLPCGHWYMEIKPGASFVGGGLYELSPIQLKLLREDIDYQPQTWRAILSAPDFVKAFGTLQGEQLKTSPKGYPKDHPAVDLLRYKQFLVAKPFSDEALSLPGLIQEIVELYKASRPLFKHFAQALSFREEA